MKKELTDAEYCRLLKIYLSCTRRNWTFHVDEKIDRIITKIRCNERDEVMSTIEDLIYEYCEEDEILEKLDELERDKV